MTKLTDILYQILLEEKKKRDRCLRIADRKYDTHSAYKSGAVVRCRQGDIWKDLKEGELDESKQVGTIYHYTTFRAGLKILESNQLISTETADSTKTNPIYGVSFTRYKGFHNNHNIGFDVSSFGQTPQIRFTVDGDKLSSRYKMQPYAQIGGSRRFEKHHQEFEAEERAVSNKPFAIPILPYLKSIDILVEYKKPRKDSSGEYDFDEEYDYRTFAPIRAEIIKFTQDKKLPINLIINKNGDPWPDKIKPGLINKILNWFTVKETIKKIIEEDNVGDVYQAALTQTEKEALELVDKNWDNFGGEECNNGFCDIFAKNLAKHLPGSKIMSTEDNRSGTFGHVWIQYKGNYFDAETPNGVTSWKKLPWMVKFYNKNKEYPTDIEFINEAESLHKWFNRQGAKGKEKGWVDCNAPDGDGGYKSCGRKEGEKRSKYPACRPTAAQCKTKGKGKTWGKTK